MNHAVDISKFHKSFGNKEVIKQMDLQIDSGEVYALIGANGSGKTTTIRCLLNIYTIYQGELLVYGQRYTEKQAHILGYLPEERGLYLGMRTLDALVYHATLKGMSKKDATTASREYLESVGIAEKGSQEIRKLSSGQQQKVQLGLALIHQPKLLILDEPTKGLDPVNRKLLIDMIMELRDNGTTVLFSTHILEEVEKVANKVGILHNGRIALDGSVNKVREEAADGSYYIVIPEGTTIPKIDGISTTPFREGYLVRTVKPAEDNEVLKKLLNEGVKIRSFERYLPTIEQIFIDIMKGNN
ncbi:ATP-binding cassette domain-containing protein [Candidatus Nomurabacteria bacterium]|uniref:ATP-binding cassette domain-containing protein n=1 Tax=Candidatus Dojkabacteria bacterium TaxID=2099670 RepID=A0A955I4Y4_9BACT|nr:ATP-binding cassette domain-containing protein [Candidatus Dojkabacteria bacterium]MCB9790391.1 ATP-binding cassette domain-containing protein [Candidatus Nomurabacteria bacterium]MCB9803679.1 ATP-binding cassette domain-containing protein [Candidatus Nomurabacteria bacterium]